MVKAVLDTYLGDLIHKMAASSGSEDPCFELEDYARG